MKTALVTGGGRGIGAAICMSLARSHYRVLIGVRQIGEEAVALRQAIQSISGAGELVCADVRRPVGIAVQIEQLGCGQLDLLVQNAGVVRDAPLPGTSDEDWEDTLDTNYWGATGVYDGCALLLGRADPGVVVSLGSISGLRPRKGHGAYSVSKAMLIAWTKAQAAASPNGNRYFCLSPGPVDTAMLRSTPWYDDAVARVPLGRYAKPQEIADWVVLLAENPHLFANGCNIVVDGGTSKV